MCFLDRNVGLKTGTWWHVFTPIPGLAPPVRLVMRRTLRGVNTVAL